MPDGSPGSAPRETRRFAGITWEGQGDGKALARYSSSDGMLRQWIWDAWNNGG